MDKKDKEHEFRLHLYDKLWENIIHKENRVWTFLAVYGAAIGIGVGSNALASLRIEAGFIIVLLTFWAAEITLDADWWSIRNRLMVTGIERKTPEAALGVIPSFYQKPRFTSGSIHNVSLLVFAAIGYVVIHIALREIEYEIHSPQSLATLVVLLYGLAVAVMGRCLHVREQQIADYYNTFEHLRATESAHQQELKEDTSEEELRKQECADRRGKSLRLPVLILFLVLSLTLDFRFSARMGSFVFTTLASIQALLVIAFIIQWGYYGSNAFDRQAVGLSFNGFKAPEKAIHSVRTHGLFSIAIVTLYMLALLTIWAGLGINTEAPTEAVETAAQETE